jgi:hypothetical protein
MRTVGMIMCTFCDVALEKFKFALFLVVEIEMHGE